MATNRPSIRFLRRFRQLHVSNAAKAEPPTQGVAAHGAPSSVVFAVPTRPENAPEPSLNEGELEAVAQRAH